MSRLVVEPQSLGLAFVQWLTLWIVIVILSVWVRDLPGSTHRQVCAAATGLYLGDDPVRLQNYQACMEYSPPKSNHD